MPRCLARIEPAAGRALVALLVITTACTTTDPDAVTSSTATTVGDTVPASTTTSTTEPPPASTTARTTTTTTTTVAALVVGDFGDGSAQQAAVADAMQAVAQEREVSAIITTGDNLYVTDPTVWTNAYGWVEELGIPVWVSWGNHDIQSSARRQLMQSLFHPPGRWYAKRLGGSTLVVVLDANQVGNEEQSAWLEETLAAHDAGAVIVVFHQPAFSCSLHKSSRTVQRAWVPLFERYEVDLVLNGHDHNYQRFEKGATTYIVSGGGGGVLYKVTSCPDGTDAPLVSVDRDRHFLQLVISDTSIVVRAINPDGELLDEVALEY
jgi:predicted phosphodiesterase